MRVTAKLYGFMSWLGTYVRLSFYIACEAVKPRTPGLRLNAAEAETPRLGADPLGDLSKSSLVPRSWSYRPGRAAQDLESFQQVELVWVRRPRRQGMLL